MERPEFTWSSSSEPPGWPDANREEGRGRKSECVLLHVHYCPPRAATLGSPTFARRVDSDRWEHTMTGNVEQFCQLEWSDR